MGFVALSDIRVIIAFWIGAISTLISIMMVIEVLRMRISLLFNQRNKQYFKDIVQEFLILNIAGEKPAALKIKNRDLSYFLLQWVHFQEILRGDSKQRLNQVLRDCHLEKKIRKLLVKGDLKDRLTAAITLGHSGDRDEQVWKQLLTLLVNPSPLLSITAARALIMIDSDKAKNSVVPVIIRRRDWMPSRLALILKQADTDFQEAFLDKLNSYALKSPPYLPRLIQSITGLQLSKPLPFVEKFVTTSKDNNLVVASLGLIFHPSELELVRGRFHDPHWSVQAQIATVLGRIGMPQDTHYLLSLLDSEHWWVRHRASQALNQLPFINQSNSNASDRNYLQQGVAEKESG